MKLLIEWFRYANHKPSTISFHSSVVIFVTAIRQGECGRERGDKNIGKIKIRQPKRKWLIFKPQFQCLLSSILFYDLSVTPFLSSPPPSPSIHFSRSKAFRHSEETTRNDLTKCCRTFLFRAKTCTFFLRLTIGKQ